MPMVEVDETELARYRQIAGFVNTALNNPKTRRKILEADKTLNPEKAIPELDAADPLHDEIKALREEVAKDREERVKRETEDQDKKTKADWDRMWAQGQQRLRDQRYSDEAIGEIEKLMTERNIPDHDAGAALFERLHPPPPPSMNGSSRFDWFSGNDTAMPDVKMLVEDQNYDAWLGQAVDKARADYRANGR